MSNELHQLQEKVESLSRLVESLRWSRSSYYHSIRFILLPLHLAVIFGGKFLLAGAGLMSFRSFSLMAMAFTVLCLVADLVCYGQYISYSGKNGSSELYRLQALS
jgi:hypothetical protein